MPCKGMVTCGSTFMRGLLREGPTLIGSHGTKPMPLLMLFIQGLFAPTVPYTAALPTMLQAKVTRFAGEVALATCAIFTLPSSVLTFSS